MKERAISPWIAVAAITRWNRVAVRAGLGCPRNVQMRWSSSGLMMCSNLHACVCASESSTEKCPKRPLGRR